MTDFRDLYQAQDTADIYGLWNSGNRNVLYVLPTGGGKSVVASGIAYRENSTGAHGAIIAHRNELVGQMSMHIASRGVHHRLIASKETVGQITAKHRKEFRGYSFVNPKANCAVVGIDTLNARADELKEWAAQQDYWINDEAHHVLRLNKWGRGLELFTNARRGLGITASPARADGQGLGRHADGLFDAMWLGPDMRTLIDNGALSDYQIAVPESDFRIDDDAITDGGDFSQKRMREASDKSKLVGDVVSEYVKRALFKRAICFAIDVKDAGDIAARFNAVGISAAAVSSKTPTTVRDDYVERFRDGRLMVLVNVDLFGEGFDVPACEVVIMARPTASLAVYLQQFGRALRIMFGKLYGLIIDHVGNWKRHGFPDRVRYWSLDRRDKRAKRAKDPEDTELTSCRHCSKAYERFRLVCPYCLQAPPLPPPAGRSIEAVDGDLILLDADTCARMRQQTELPLPAQMAEKVGSAFGGFAGTKAANDAIAKRQAQELLKHEIAQWAAIQRQKGRDDREIHKRFYLTAGVDVLSALSRERTRQEFDKLAETVRGWYAT